MVTWHKGAFVRASLEFALHREARAESCLDGFYRSKAAREVEALRVWIPDDMQEARGALVRDTCAVVDE